MTSPESLNKNSSKPRKEERAAIEANLKGLKEMRQKKRSETLKNIWVNLRGGKEMVESRKQSKEGRERLRDIKKETKDRYRAVQQLRRERNIAREARLQAESAERAKQQDEGEIENEKFDNAKYWEDLGFEAKGISEEYDRVNQPRWNKARMKEIAINRTRLAYEDSKLAAEYAELEKTVEPKIAIVEELDKAA